MTEQVDVKLKTCHWKNQIQSYDKLVRDEESKLNVNEGIKLGWVEGVLNPCLLSIWGVMLFLRMPWIVGQAGIFDSILIIFISLIIIIITTFSLSAISTNGRVKGGGLYFIISRSIGPEFGASIGILLALANTILVALNTIGFCLSLKSLLHTFNIHAMDSNFVFILTGFIAILIMGILCCVGMDDEAKIQNILLIFIVGAIVDVLIGSFLGPTTDVAIASGFTGLSMKTFKENWYSDYTTEQSFFTIFAVFFPSVTGIQAGANISGDLKDPSASIPKGTLLSILITITSYIVLVLVPGAVQLRDASGNPNELLNGFYLNCSFRNCTQGLHNNENVMQTISLWPYLIYLGCFAATLSTALTALIAVPKILQRMGQDDIYPFLKYLSKGYGKSNEPYRAHVLAIVISSIFLLIGELNEIASFISTIYLCAYALLNLCTFHVAHFQPLGWRPSYEFYNKWLSLAGAIICFLVMILIDKQMSVIVGCIIWILYIIAAEKKDDINWGSSKQIQQIKTVINNVYMADTIQQHVKNYVPNIMVLSGEPESRKELVYLAHIITKNNGLQTCINIIKNPLIQKQKKELLEKGANWLNQTGIKSLYNVLDNIDLDIGVHIINSCGHGILKPNIIVIGYKHGWFKCTDDDIQTYLNILNLSNMDGIATIIVRLPKTDTTYKSKSNNRPWIDQIQSFNELYHEEENKVEVNPGIKLGWIKGVLVPCLLSIWGVMLFLRMPWILGQAGIFHSIIIILIALVIILITTFSLSAISTNGKVKGGGLYFIISRSIGPEFGASIGILLAFANTISAAMNTIGFCISLRSLLQQNDIHVIDSNLNFRALGVVSIIIMSILCCIGMDREAEVQNALLIAIIVGIFNVIIGSYNGPKSNAAKASGFTGFSMKTFKQNWYPDYRIENNIHQSFFTIFSVFFPSVTGIQAGANISGDLKDPSASIPKGTLLSILITITSYIVLIVVPGSVQLREASGYENELQDEFYLNCSFRNCTKGLYKDDNLMQSISLWPITIYFGCFGATISTALTALISVPKLLQRMGQDDIYPYLKYLAKGYGKSKEPYRAHIFAMVVSSVLLIIGELNNIASLISTIYLSAYAMLNLCTFHIAYFNPLGWRPTYKFYNKWLSLAAAIICILVMIFIDKKMSAIVGCAVCVLYRIAARKKEVINWGSSKQTRHIKTFIKAVYKSNTIQYHVKNYLPNLIVFSGNPESRKKLVSLAHLITKNYGIQLCVNIEKMSLTPRQKKIRLDKGIQWLRNSGIKSLYVVIDNIGLDLATHMVYSCGHGQFKPNIVMVGYKSDWLNCPYQDLQTYLNIFNVANINGMSTIMVRISSTESFEDQNLLVQDFKHLSKKEEILYKTQSVQNTSIRNQQKVADCFVKIKIKEFSFEKKKPNHGTVDVWWLYSDGGLSLIISYILKHSITWKNCKFRIFGVTNKVECLSEEKNKLKQLLSLYRIDFDYLDIILSNTTDPTTMTYFNSLFERASSKENQFDEYNLQKEYISETLFLRDLIELHSFNSDLIILTTPKNNEEINILFMCWIETISRGLPPCIIINGSTESVITVNA